MATPSRLTRPTAPPPPLGLGLVRELAQRAARPDFPKLEAQLRSSGYCARPVRLRGHIETRDPDGRRRVWSTDAEPDGVLRKACGNRREAVCPPCAERYRGDAYQLIAAGLRGGKGVPETVVEHPAVFVTFTAPSFGVVHTGRIGPDGEARRCRPRRDAPLCPHGVRLSCGKVHAQDDPCLGEPLCHECFGHRAAVIWNNVLSELWRRTTTYVPRTMARRTGMTQKRLRVLVRLSYIKVAEYQRRGLVHLHVVVRLDRAMPAYRIERLADLVEARLAQRRAAGEERLLTAAAVAEIVGVHAETVRRAIRCGAIETAGYVGSRPRVRRAAVEAWVARGQRPAPLPSGSGFGPGRMTS